MLLQVDKSIIGWDSIVGAWSRLENHCVLGEDVQVKVRLLDSSAGMQQQGPCAAQHSPATPTFNSSTTAAGMHTMLLGLLVDLEHMTPSTCPPSCNT
jgi:hypothetical protein